MLVRERYWTKDEADVPATHIFSEPRLLALALLLGHHVYQNWVLIGGSGCPCFVGGQGAGAAPQRAAAGQCRDSGPPSEAGAR